VRTWVRFAAAIVLAGVGLALAAILMVPEAQAFFTAGKGQKGDLAASLRPLSERSVVLARDGSTIAVLHAEENRVPVKLSDVPPQVSKAVIDIEDDRFYEHGGVDLRSLGRALATNISAGGVRQGGSTITQQLVKNCCSRRSRTSTASSRKRSCRCGSSRRCRSSRSSSAT
jgi:penicillin-binding protein 1A